MTAPRSALGAPRAELEALVAGVRGALRERGESPGPDWVEEAVAGLSTGSLSGWYFPEGDPGGAGIAIGSLRRGILSAHVHVEGGPDPPGRAIELLTALRAELFPRAHRLVAGFTGLSREGEEEIGRRLGGRGSAALVTRIAMERPIGERDAEPLGGTPAGTVHMAIRSVPREALAELDGQAFAGTPDEQLVGRDRTEIRRNLDEILEGRFGRVIEEASTTLVTVPPGELVAGLLTAECNPRQAIFLDLMVSPAHRRRGYGRYLLRWGFRALWSLGYSSARLWVTEANRSARSLYEAEGFRPTATALVYRETGGSDGQPQSG
ncbi:MAG: GNAT family N-acetyltransferase [Thermoplasmata archaeon]